MARNYVWSGQANSEGGPILVADVDVFCRWSGAKETWSKDAAYRVHYYGPLIERLPAKLQPSGADSWHQYAVCAGMDATREYIRELHQAAQKLEPKLETRRQRVMSAEEILSKGRAALTSEAGMGEWLGSWRDHMEQGIDLELGQKRLLHVAARPDTDYARACEALTEEVAFLTIGDAPALVWELEGSGTASIGRENDGLLLIRTWLGAEGEENEQAAERAARDHATKASEEDEEAAGTIRLSSGYVAVVWAPVAAADVAGAGDNADEIMRALRSTAGKPPAELSANGMHGVGSLVRLPPGEYRVSHGVYETEDEDEDEDYSYRCRWLRLSPVEAALGLNGD